MIVRSDTMRAVLGQSAVTVHDAIDSQDALIAFLDIMYSNVENDKWVVLLASRNDFLDSMEYLKTTQSMSFVKFTSTGDYFFKGPLGEDIMFARHRDRLRGSMFMKYKKIEG